MQGNIREFLRKNTLSVQVLRGGGGGLIAKILSVVSQFVLAVVLARALGADNFGVYSYAFAVAVGLRIVCQFGLPNLLVRETATADSEGDWARMKGLWIWSLQTGAGLSVCAWLLGGLTIFFLQSQISDVAFRTYLWALVLVPIMALGTVTGGALRGLRYILPGQLPEFVLRPAICAVLVAAVVFGFGVTQPSAADAMVLHVIAGTISLVIGGGFLGYFRPRAVSASLAAVYERRVWARSAVPMAVATGLQFCNMQADLLVLGLFHPSADVGHYRAAMQLALVATLGLTVVNVALSPYFARLHSQGDRARLQRLVTASAIAATASAAPVALLLSLSGAAVLDVVFGAPYAAGAVVATVLAGAHSVNAFFGSVGVLLHMTGYEKDAMKGIAVAAGLNIALNFILVPSYAGEGAASATLCSMIAWNMILWYAVRRRLGVRTTALGVV